MTPKILTIGSAYWDMILRMPRVPAPGETLVPEDGGISYLPDGAGVLTAVALAKLGARSRLSCRVGQDIDGQRLYTVCAEAGVDTSAVIADPRTPTGTRVLIADQPKAPRSVLFPGASLHLTRDNIGDAFSDQPDGVCINLDLPEDTVLDAASLAAQRHIPIFLHATPARPEFPFPKLPPLEVFCQNEQDTEVYTGIRPNGSDAALKAMLVLCKTVKANYYVIRMGDRGAFIFDGRHFSMVSPYAVKPVDTAAVEEGFMAGLALEYLRSRGDITAATRFAHTVSAIALIRPGTVSSLPTSDEVNGFIAKNGIR